MLCQKSFLQLNSHQHFSKVPSAIQPFLGYLTGEKLHLILLCNFLIAVKLNIFPYIIIAYISSTHYLYLPFS